MCTYIAIQPHTTPLIKSTLQIYVSHSTTRCARILAGHLNAREDRMKARNHSWKIQTDSVLD